MLQPEKFSRTKLVVSAIKCNMTAVIVECGLMVRFCCCTVIVMHVSPYDGMICRLQPAAAVAASGKAPFRHFSFSTFRINCIL